MQKLAVKLREATKQNPFQKNMYDSRVFNLNILIDIVLKY